MKMQCKTCPAMPAVQETPRKEEVPILGRNSCFPLKLHQLLCYATANNLESIICWSSDGKGFHVLDPNELMKHIAPLFFPNQAKFRSFERMLNIWGFKREGARGTTKSLWCNPNFQRYRSDLCRYMVRIENKGTKKRIATGRNRYVFVKTKVLNSEQQLRQLHAALKFFSDETPTQNKGTKTRLPFKKREILARKQGCNNEETNGAKQRDAEAIKSSSTQSHHRMNIPSIVATVPGRQQDKNGRKVEPSRSSSCSRDEGMERPSPAAHHPAKTAEKGRPTFVRRRILPTRTRSEQCNWQKLVSFGSGISSRPGFYRITEPHCQKAVPSCERSSISNGILSKESSSGRRAPSLVDEKSACENDDFGRLLQSGSTGEKKVHLEGQFDDAPDDSSDDSLRGLADVAMLG